MRTDSARLTQRAAAEECGLSEIWWRQIESGHTDYAPGDTLARMCYAVGVSPRQLHRMGEEDLADILEQRRDILDEEPDDMESHLMRTPGLSEAQCVALVTVAKTMRRD
jgi:transcriptional regulator with XRE-family HTH domain